MVRCKCIIGVILVANSLAGCCDLTHDPAKCKWSYSFDGDAENFVEPGIFRPRGAQRVDLMDRTSGKMRIRISMRSNEVILELPDDGSRDTREKGNTASGTLTATLLLTYTFQQSEASNPARLNELRGYLRDAQGKTPERVPMVGSVEAEVKDGKVIQVKVSLRSAREVPLFAWRDSMAGAMNETPLNRSAVATIDGVFYGYWEHTPMVLL
jgi:hypothetical protein